jgi:hypothetical protein
MNEHNSGTADSIPQPVPYKDRSAGLVIFGVLTTLMGGLCGLFVPLMLAGQAGYAKASGASSYSMILPSVFMYAVLAVALVWLGIGSIMARRWARALLLIFSWSWLVMGLMTLASMAFFMPTMRATLSSTTGPNGQPALPPGAVTAMIVVMSLIFGFVFLILPAAWTFFYNSRHVKATCEARDPVVRWTDACPLPVLGLCLILLPALPMMLIMPFAGHWALPFFGTFLTGAPCSILSVAVAAIWGYSAWALYKLEQRGWWLILIAMLLYAVSTIITFARHDMMDFYRLMDFPQAELDQMQKSGFLQIGKHMPWLMALFMAPFLGYLIFIKRYMRDGPSQDPAAAK